MPQNTNKSFPYLFLLMANIIPIVAVWENKFTFFQVIYLYWFETVLLIIPAWVRIAMAQGTQTESGQTLNVALEAIKNSRNEGEEPKPFTPWQKWGIMVRFGFIKLFIMGFYLIFIVVFTGLMVGKKEEGIIVFKTMFFYDPIFNAAVLVFIISMTVQLIAGYIMNGKYKIMSPLNYNNFFDGRTIILHISIVLTTFMYSWWFKDKPHESLGPVAFTTFFVFLKTILDLLSLKNENYKMPSAEVTYI